MKPFKVIILPEAQMDLRQATAYYQEINDALSKRFVATARQALFQIRMQPFSYSFLYSDIRSYTLNTFPYSYHLLIQEESILVVGLYHHA